MSDRSSAYAREASATVSQDLTHEDFAIGYSLWTALSYGDLRPICDLLDPNVPGAQLAGEPGWRIERQMGLGEPQLRARRLLERFPHGRDLIGDPGPKAGADPSWPGSARFKVDLYEPDEFGNPKYPLRYYDAATFEEFLRTILAVYVKYHPGSAPQVEQILAHARYWVERDAGQGGRET